MLKRARERLQPTDIGVPAGFRRRVPGLRREEVAQLAGVSVDYVVRLEQGRGPCSSRGAAPGPPDRCSALARALRLDDDERDELFNLAGTPPPPPGRISDVVRPSVQRLIDRLADLPVMVISAKGDMLAWNAIAAALLGDWSRHPVHQRNMNWQRFLGTDSRVAMTDEEREATAAQSVANLRATAAKYPHDPGLADLIADLRQHSPDFVRLWDAGSAKPWRSHRKTIARSDHLGLRVPARPRRGPDRRRVLRGARHPRGGRARAAARRRNAGHAAVATGLTGRRASPIAGSSAQAHDGGSTVSRRCRR